MLLGMVKEKFSRARVALVVTVEKAGQLLQKLTQNQAHFSRARFYWRVDIFLGGYFTACIAFLHNFYTAFWDTSIINQYNKGVVRMKTNVKIMSALVAFVLVFASIGSVSADTLDEATYGAGFGMDGDDEDDGLLADYMEAAIAEGLGLTVEELNAYEDDGANHYEIALALGFSAEEFGAIMDNARVTANAMAIEDGIIPEQFGKAVNRRGMYGMGLDGDGQPSFGKRTDDDSRGQFGSGLNDGLRQNLGKRTDDDFRGGLGGGMVNGEDCDPETCLADPAGIGLGRGRRR